MAIFFFHVVRSEKVWTKISPQLTRLKNRTLQRRTYKFVSVFNFRSITKTKAKDKESANKVCS